MNKLLSIIIVALAAASSVGAREVVRINEGWRFYTLSEGREKAMTVNLPHTWNRDATTQGRDYYRGSGNYVRNILVPQAWNGQRIYLKSYGANSAVDVFINGLFAGSHRGGYTAFTIEITKQIRFGERNAILFVVNNAPTMDILPTGGTMNVYGGLFRDVEVIACPGAHVAPDDYGANGLYMRQRKIEAGKAEYDAVVKITGRKDRNVSLRLCVMGAGKDTAVVTETVARLDNSGRVTAILPFTIDKPVFWDGTRNPHLYTAWVKIFDGTAAPDSVAVPLGIRTFNFDTNRGFILNGKPYRLRGVIATQDRLGLGNAVSIEHLEQDLDLIQEMGANAVRTPLPCSPAFYDMCDRRGIVVWSDLPLMGPSYISERGFINSPAFKDNGKTQLTEIIRQGVNHPSIMTWGLFSELNMRGDNPVSYIKELAALASQEDPNRATVASSNQDGDINFATDLISWAHEYGWGEGQPSDIAVWLDEYRASWSKLKTSISYGAGASVYQQADTLSRPVVNAPWHPERWQTYLHEVYFAHVNPVEWFWGWFVANMFDCGAATRRWGDGSGVDDRGLVTFDRAIRKDAFYFYKANWNDEEKFVYIAERRWNRRNHTSQNVKVYTNASQAELFLNGVSQGVKQPTNGTILWENVTMKVGENELVVLSERLKDNCTITVAPAKAVRL